MPWRRSRHSAGRLALSYSPPGDVGLGPARDDARWWREGCPTGTWAWRSSNDPSAFLHHRLDHARARLQPARELADHLVQARPVRHPRPRVDPPLLDQPDDPREV